MKEEIVHAQAHRTAKRLFLCEVEFFSRKMQSYLAWQTVSV